MPKQHQVPPFHLGLHGKLYSTNQHHAAAEGLGGADTVFQQRQHQCWVEHLQNAFVRDGKYI